MSAFKKFYDQVVAVLSGKHTKVFEQTNTKAWKQNMWVFSENGVGIIAELNEPVVVHYVNSLGETTAVESVASKLLRQATYLEIPASRRGSKEVANKLGYK